MAWINDDELLNLERTRQNAVNDLRSKNILIDTDADINEAYEKYKSLNNSAQLLDGSIGEIVRDDNITNLKYGALSEMPQLKKAYFKNVVRIKGMMIADSPLVEHLEAPNAITIDILANYTNSVNYAMSTMYFPHVTQVAAEFLRMIGNVQKFIFPKLSGTPKNFSSVFSRKAAPLILIDSKFETFSKDINTTGFNSLETLVLRGDNLPTLATTSLFPNSNLKIYIKSEFVEDLKEETNWSALPCMVNDDAVVALETSEYADERWFEDTDEFKLNYIYQDLDDESEEINNE